MGDTPTRTEPQGAAHALVLGRRRDVTFIWQLDGGLELVTNLDLLRLSRIDVEALRDFLAHPEDALGIAARRAALSRQGR